MIGYKNGASKFLNSCLTGFLYETRKSNLDKVNGGARYHVMRTYIVPQPVISTQIIIQDIY